MPSIDILLATYNGGRFLEAQLESLLAQTYGDWRCLVRDDGSTDNTCQILESYAQKYPDNIFIVKDKQGNLGPSGNFSALMGVSDAPYVMFCDQDDVWFPEKIAHTLQALQKLEVKYGKDVPLLVHADMEVVTDELSPIHPSFMKWQHLDPNRNRIKDLLLKNIAVGATLLINRPLLEKAGPVPKEAIMHDYWIAWVASVFGHVYFLDKAMLRYRIHDNNVTAKKPLDIPTAVRNLSIVRAQVKQHFTKTFLLAEIFVKRYGPTISKKDRSILSIFIDLRDASCLKKRWILLTHRFSKHRVVANVGMFLLC